MMRCPRTERIEQIAAGEEDPALLRVRAHVDECPRCRELLDQIKAHMLELGSPSDELEPPDES